jgi:hypothetical protein
VERKYGKARRIWVMDRGIVSEENLVVRAPKWEAPPTGVAAGAPA